MLAPAQLISFVLLTAGLTTAVAQAKTSNQSSRACTPFDIIDCQTFTQDREKGIFPRKATRLVLNSSEQKKAQVKIERVKTRLLQATRELITGSTSRDKLTSEQKAMLDRLASLKFETTHAEHPNCVIPEEHGFPQAGYAPSRHLIVICPTAASGSEEELTLQLAHEIGHVISPCMMGKSFNDVSTQLSNPKTAQAAIMKCQDRVGKRLSEQDSDFIPLDSTMAASLSQSFLHSKRFVQDEETLGAGEMNLLKTCGLLKERRNSTVVEPLHFSKGLQCLVDRYASASTSSVHAPNGLASSEQAPSEGPTGPDSRVDIEDEPANIDTQTGTKAEDATRSAQATEPPACNSLVEESFGDAFASQLLNKIVKVRQLDLKSTQATFTTMVRMACMEKQTGQPVNSPEKYPSAADRVRTLANAPAILNALGCSQIEGASTDNFCSLWGPSGQTESMTANHVNRQMETAAPREPQPRFQQMKESSHQEVKAIK